MMKTPEPILSRQRNYYRKKKKIPLDAPPRTRAEPLNVARRGTGNRGGKIWMPEESWQLLLLLQLHGDKTRGEVLAELVREKCLLHKFI